MIKMYTDGSFNTNSNVGGWAAIILNNDVESVYSGNSMEKQGFGHSIINPPTAQRMEIIAVLEGLLKFEEPSSIEVISDSQYVVNTMSKGWLNSWVKENDNEKKHLDLWRVIYTLSKIHNLKFTWVKGHNGDYYNEKCDELAQSETKSLISLESLMNEEKERDLYFKGFKQEVPFKLDENDFAKNNIEVEINNETKDLETSSTTHVVKTAKSPKKKKKSSKKYYYAVAKGRQIGVFKTWAECSKNVNKYRGAIYKKFDTEKEALDFIRKNK